MPLRSVELFKFLKRKVSAIKNRKYNLEYQSNIIEYRSTLRERSNDRHDDSQCETISHCTLLNPNYRCLSPLWKGNETRDERKHRHSGNLIKGIHGNESTDNGTSRDNCGGAINPVRITWMQLLPCHLLDPSPFYTQRDNPFVETRVLCVCVCVC